MYLFFLLRKTHPKTPPASLSRRQRLLLPLYVFFVFVSNTYSFFFFSFFFFLPLCSLFSFLCFFFLFLAVPSVAHFAIRSPTAKESRRNNAHSRES